MLLVSLGGVRPPPNVSQPTFMLNSGANELPSVFLSFSIDIPAAASTHHSHSSAPMESHFSSEKTRETLNGPPKKWTQSVKKGDIFTLLWPADSEIWQLCTFLVS